MQVFGSFPSCVTKGIKVLLHLKRKLSNTLLNLILQMGTLKKNNIYLLEKKLSGIIWWLKQPTQFSHSLQYK